ncbi:BlaI/MecI/CopY family transcriptional regulator [Amycolatopsis alkalitolerans]|uniref:BlaI/MecI/CopY family transcriptional regulator n=1 Tax=Amycolatopsis alkalitolerans TaxID=2547244 RepID=A0A5C4M409_9PSEU|nr:BlaI/MecI/CopY family transcriptional regulator [Amycolatopsis alkalitolerans]TNC25845.1 BlaI/MecI/CopY family transcriptional regulator [Amycolatopsis alkalitolerans]
MARLRGGHRRGPGELETEVLAALWNRRGPMTAADVQQGLGGDLAYTTVVTILTRLSDKGAVTREKQGRSYLYAPVEDEAGLAARRMGKLLDAHPDRARVLARFVSNLSSADEETLRAALRDPDGD